MVDQHGSEDSDPDENCAEIESNDDMSDNEEETNHSITVQDTGPASYDAKNRAYYSKKGFCFLCKKFQVRLDKHFLKYNVHKDDERVLEVRKSAPQSVARTEALSKLRNLGNYEHNCQVLNSKKGEIIVVKRPSATKSKEDISYKHYLPCVECLGFYHYSHLWEHKCEKLQKDHRPIATSKTFLYGSLQTNEKRNEKLDKAIETMKRKDLSEIIRNDKLLYNYGIWMYVKHETNIDQTGYIMNKLREIARMLQQVEKNKGQKIQLSDLMKGQEFETIVKALKDMGKKGPSICKRIGESLLKIIVVHKGMLIRSGTSNEDRDHANDFEWMLEKQWGDLVTVPAQRELYMKKNSKPASVPFTEDVTKFAEFIDNLIETVHSEVQNNDLSRGRLLHELCLAKLITFNKRRYVLFYHTLYQKTKL